VARRTEGSQIRSVVGKGNVVGQIDDVMNVAGWFSLAILADRLLGQDLASQPLPAGRAVDSSMGLVSRPLTLADRPDSLHTLSSRLTLQIRQTTVEFSTLNRR